MSTHTAHQGIDATGPSSAGAGHFFGAPHTPAGRLTVAFAILFAVFMVVFFVLVAAGVTGGDTLFSTTGWPLTASAVPAALFGIGAGVTGIFALFRGERSVFVLVSMLLGLFVIFFVAGEIIFPH